MSDMSHKIKGVAKEMSDNEQQFAAEKIVSRRVRKGRVEYLIEPENTWEPAENLVFCTEMIKSYEENRRLRKNKSETKRASSSLTRSSKRRCLEVTGEESEAASENIQMAKKRGRKPQKEFLEKEQPNKTANNKLKTYLKENNKTTVTAAAAANENTTDLKAIDVASVVSITSTEHTNTADNDSKPLTTSSGTWQLNGKKFVSNFLTRQPTPKTGFERGLLPEEILGVAEFKGNLYLVIKFKGDDEPHMVHNELANKEIPQMVIEFYEKSLCWQPSDD